MDHFGQGLGNRQLEQDWKDVLSLPFFTFIEEKQEQWKQIIKINLKQFISCQQDVHFEEQYHYLYSSNGDYFSFNDISNNTIYVIQIQTQKQKLKIKYQESSQVDIQFSNDSQYFIWMEDGQANIMNLIDNEKDFSILYDARVELDIMISYCYLYATSVIIDKKENQTCIFDIKIYNLNTKILIKQFQFRPDQYIFFHSQIQNHLYEILQTLKELFYFLILFPPKNSASSLNDAARENSENYNGFLINQSLPSSYYLRILRRSKWCQMISFFFYSELDINCQACDQPQQKNIFFLLKINPSVISNNLQKRLSFILQINDESSINYVYNTQ